MVQHAYWTGHIRLSLVSFPVRIYNAVTETEKIRLHKYDRNSGDRIHYQNVNQEGDIVEPDDIVRGYEYEKGSFVPIEDEELDKLKMESKHTIDLVQFSPSDAIDPIYYDNPYFIAPDGEIALEAYITLREALRDSGNVALGQIVLSNKERIVAIKPYGKGMVMETLRYSYEVRRAEDYFGDIKSVAVDKEQLKLAEQLIDSKKADFNPDQFEDRYQQGLQEIINAKIEGRRPNYGKDSGPAKVINIMDALKRSLNQTKKSAKKTNAAKKSPPKNAKKKSASPRSRKKA